MRDQDNAEMEWMLEVRDGRIGRTGLLFERYKTPLFNFFLRITGHWDDSQDLVQESFVRLIKYRTTFKGDGTFRGWLFHLARNVSIDYFRSKSRENRHVRDRTEWETQFGQSSGTADQDHSEHMNRLHSALLELPVEYREVILLSRFEELKYKEIGRMLGCSEGAVKLRVFRALHALRKIVLTNEQI